MRSVPIEFDDAVEFIEFRKADEDEEKENIGLNARIEIKPVEIYKLPSGQTAVIIMRDTSRIHRNKITGERVRPTPIIAIVTQNPDDPWGKSYSYHNNTSKGSRPIQVNPTQEHDDGHYQASTNESLPYFLAETNENYYVVEAFSKYSTKFRCPKLGRSDRSDSESTGDWDDSQSIGDGDSGYIGDEDYGDMGGDGGDNLHVIWSWNVSTRGDILVHVNPETSQARWACLRCTTQARFNREKFDGKGPDVVEKKHPVTVMHTVPRELRNALAEDDIIPYKKYRNEDRLKEAPKLLKVIEENQGASFYELDHLMGWDTDGRNSERIVNTYLMNKVVQKKGRKGRKGYRVYSKSYFN